MAGELTPQVFDVPIRPANQDAPSTAAPVGRLKALVNKVAVKSENAADEPGAVSGGARITVESRAGMQALTKNVRDVTTGASVSTTAGVPGANLVANLGTELVAVSSSVPYVLSENSPAWMKYPYVYSPVTVRAKSVYQDNVRIAAPDGAIIGDKILRTWSQPFSVNGSILGSRAMLVDVDGAVIRAPWTLAAGNAPYHSKVVADGTRFWVALGNGDTISMICYDTHGVQIGAIDNLLGVLEDEASPWDLTYCEGYVLLATVETGHAVVWKFTISGTTISHVKGDLTGAKASHGIAWSENAAADSNAYLLTSYADDGQYQEYAFRVGTLSATPTLTGYFSIAQTSGSGQIYDEDGEGHTTIAAGYGYSCQLTGIFRAGVLYAQISCMEDPSDLTGDVRDDRIVPLTCTIGTTATVGTTVRTVRAASRVFRHDARDVLLVYYPSADTLIVGSVAYTGEPTYFLLDVLTMQACGRFSTGTAAMEWTRIGFPDSIAGGDSAAGPYLFCLPHVFTDSAGITRVPCGFQSRQYNDTTATFIADRTGPGHFAPVQATTIQVVSAVGYQDLEFGGVGQAVEFGNELLLPGAIATSFDGANFSEQGINLAPAQPSLVASTGGAVEIGRREYVVVFQAINRDGGRVFSEPSAPVVITTSGSNNTITITGRTLRMTTRQNVTIAIYRNIITAGVPSTIRYRIDNPLQPLYNNPAVKEWTFTDTQADASIEASEHLYIDDDFRPRDPMPGFSTADIFDGRVVCDSQDGSLWFSAQRVEGDATWFSASMRIPAVTPAPLKNLVTMDRRLVEIYDKQVWFQDASGMPGPTNSSVGSIQAADKQTFTNGGTGFARLVNEGVMYSSSEGGVWIITRGGVNQRVTGPCVDDLVGRNITGIVVDASQRIHVGTGDRTVVFDQLSGVWSRNEAPVYSTLMHTLRGAVLFADSYGIYVEDPTTWTDIDHAGAQQFIVGQVEFKPFHFTGVKRYSRLWRFNAQGESRGNHTMTLIATYDPETAQSPITETWTWAVAIGDKWAFEFQPKLEQIESLSLFFVESFPAGPTYTGKSFRLEMLGFEVGLEGGLARVPLAKRIQST